MKQTHNQSQRKAREQSTRCENYHVSNAQRTSLLKLSRWVPAIAVMCVEVDKWARRLSTSPFHGFPALPPNYALIILPPLFSRGRNRMETTLAPNGFRRS